MKKKKKKDKKELISKVCFVSKPVILSASFCHKCLNIHLSAELRTWNPFLEIMPKPIALLPSKTRFPLGYIQEKSACGVFRYSRRALIYH